MRDAAAKFKRFALPQTVIGRFTARRTFKSAAFWALMFGTFAASKGIGFIVAYPTVKERVAAAASFSGNAGVNALLGQPYGGVSGGGFTAWATLGSMAMIGAVWGLLLATKTLRGEEEAGRWELLLAGQTTARRAAANVLGGLAAAVGVMFTVSAAAFLLVGSYKGLDFGFGGALYFALAAVTGAAMFIAVGALASELMATRARANGLAAAVFGLSFLVRAAGDATNYHWLVNFSPLGWIENMRPFVNPQPFWIIPCLVLIAVCAGLTIWLAGDRDLGSSIFADRDTAKPKTFWLNSPIGAAVRLNRASNISWLIAALVAAVFYGSVTKAAAQAFSDSLSAQHILNSLSHASAQSMGARSYLGIVMMIQMLLVMIYAAGAAGRMREDEADGYLDNILVRPVGRLRWLGGRLLIALGVILLIGLLTVAGLLIGTAGQNLGVSTHDLFLAGLNIIPPAVLVLGIGVFGMSVVPRLTTVIAYGVIAWSFLVQMVSSGINLSHWILDTSIFQHIALSPAVDVKWGNDLIMTTIGLILCAVGGVIFNRRDLASE